MTLIELKQKAEVLIAEGYGELDVVYPSAPHGEYEDSNDLFFIKDCDYTYPHKPAILIN